ncbi:MAG TPA: SGNH/GDSL hydrolase family protein [Gemmatimonadaceae bacterium]|nr:SGNH/GDSL hydrolase family protein [Gemmatimonadaceae bacterium]
MPVSFPHSIRRRIGAAPLAALLVILAACSDSTTEPNTEPRFPTMAVFGASLDDMGNACAAAPASCPPPPYATGRASNGPLWVEVLADSLDASLSPASAGGLNFAFGGARTGPVAGTTQTIPNMQVQATQYLQSAPTAGRAETLHIVNAATVGNDINDALLAGRTNPAAPAQIVAASVQNIVTLVQSLYDGGARHVLLANSTDIGRTPLVAAQGALVSAVASQLSQQFNQGLAAALPSLRTSTPGLTLYTLDLGALTAEVFASPATFGFTNLTAPCVVPTPPSLCTAPDTYFFWDGFHPTAATGRLVATRALRALGR